LSEIFQRIGDGKEEYKNMFFEKDDNDFNILHYLNIFQNLTIPKFNEFPNFSKGIKKNNNFWAIQI
jgi:hypothetical protein